MFLNEQKYYLKRFQNNLDDNKSWNWKKRHEKIKKRIEMKISYVKLRKIKSSLVYVQINTVSYHETTN